MAPWQQLALTVFVTVISSGGLWSVVQIWYQNKKQKESAETQALKAILHNSLYKRCMECIAKGYVTMPEYANINEMFDPYTRLGGNGEIKKLVG